MFFYMLATRFLTTFRKEKKSRVREADILTEQVKKILRSSDQKLILMVRG